MANWRTWVGNIQDEPGASYGAKNKQTKNPKSKDISKGKLKNLPIAKTGTIYLLSTKSHLKYKKVDNLKEKGGRKIYYGSSS